MITKEQVSNAIRDAIAASEGCRDPYHGVIADKAAEAVLALLPKQCAPTMEEVGSAIDRADRRYMGYTNDRICAVRWDKTREQFNAEFPPKSRGEFRHEELAALYAAQPTVREAKAEGWEEGVREVARRCGCASVGLNPYRSEADHG